MTLDSILPATPQRPDLVVDDTGRVSTAEVQERVQAVAAALRARGARPGDRVAFHLPNGLDSVVAYHACWRAGAVAVALHPAAGSHQLTSALEQARPAVIIAGPDSPPMGSLGSLHPTTLDDLIAESHTEPSATANSQSATTTDHGRKPPPGDREAETANSQSTTTDHGRKPPPGDREAETASPQSATTTDQSRKPPAGDRETETANPQSTTDTGHGRKPPPGDREAETASPQSTTAAGAGQRPARVSDDADAVVTFTSGATGTPRGVVHTHRSLAYKTAQLIDTHGLTGDDTALVPNPLAHTAGLLYGVLIPGAGGMKTVLMSRWDPSRALDLIERESVTYMVGPPTLFTTLMDCADFEPARAATLRMISCGGASVTPAFCRRAEATLGVVVKRSYGSTEAPTIATARFDDPPPKMVATDGRAFGAAKLRVDSSGELWVTGPGLARGYLHPADTESAFVDGWFRTGDLARIEDGWLIVTGRIGDRIIRGGENISAAEVEQHLEAHPAVLHAAAVAEPHERLGERVAAFVVAPDGFDLDTCRAWFVQRGAARFITPERVEVVRELPVLASGKVDRMSLAASLRPSSEIPTGDDSIPTGDDS